MKHSSPVGRALACNSHTAISDICFPALCHMGYISLTLIPLWSTVAQLVEPKSGIATLL